jgi:hypothetical protein
MLLTIHYNLLILLLVGGDLLVDLNFVVDRGLES